VKAPAPSRAWSWCQKDERAPQRPGRWPSRSSARRSDHGRAVEGGPAKVAATRGVRRPVSPPTVDAGFGAPVWSHALTSDRPRACDGHIFADARATYRRLASGPDPLTANHMRLLGGPPPPPSPSDLGYLRKTFGVPSRR